MTSQMDKMHLLRMQELEHNSILCQFLSLKKALSQQGTPMDILAMLNTSRVHCARYKAPRPSIDPTNCDGGRRTLHDARRLQYL